MMNKNDLAKEIAEREGGKKSLSIAQIKEVLKIICDLVKEEPVAVLKLLLK